MCEAIVEHLGQHGAGLVVLALLICLIACSLSLRLSNRSEADQGRLGWLWLLAAGLVGGAGIWTTHFVAMLSWRPGYPVAYTAGMTVLSIVIAIVGATCCFALAWKGRSGQRLLAGLLLGLVIVAMHFTGMAALEVQAALSWHLEPVIWSILAGSGLAAGSLWLAERYRILPALLFGLAVAVIHFGGMVGLHLDGDPLALPPSHGMAVETLVVGIALVVGVIFAVAAASLEVDRRRALREQGYAALLVQRNEELEAASEAKSQFVATVSHEIRTPLNAVLGYTELLAATPLDETQQRYVEVVRDTGRQLLTLVNDLLDMAKLEAGKLELEQIDFRLVDMLEQVRSLLAPRATKKGIEPGLVCETPTGLVLRGDPVRLRQVLINLVGNGIKFTSVGEVVLRVRPLDGGGDGERRVRFEVRDTGIGVPLERQKALFDAFVQAESSTARRFGGTGLGLAISKTLVEAMGGEIALVSHPGKGSLFYFDLTFPLGDSRELAAPEELPREPIRPLRVLVVDDVAVNRELVSEMLGLHGHRVLMAVDGAGALELVQREPLDLVLMDAQMPVMDGIEATRRLRRLGGPAATLPVVALTANVLAGDRQRYLAAGMDGCLTKPIIWNEMFALLSRIASGKPPTPAEPAPSPAPAPAPVAGPALLDHGMLAGMAEKLPQPVLRHLLARGLSGAAESCRRLLAADGDRALIRSEAHKLRGTAGSFGLAAISAQAALIEERLRQDEPVADLLAQLGELVAASRAAVAAFDHGDRATG